MATISSTDNVEERQNKKTTADKELALQRWQILRQVLVSGRSCTTTSDYTASVRRFKTFGLLQTHILLDDEYTVDMADWYKYTAKHWPRFSMIIRHLPNVVKPETLLGFNNTGNVCVWPSEEVMTYYCLQNADMFSGKTVIELGGGMTCLAGVAMAVSSDVKHVVITDGNEESVTNLDHIVDKNKDTFRTATVSTRVLRWGEGSLSEDLAGQFDFVLCADCLFFKEGRQDLAQTIYDLLKDEGEAVLFAPRRGDTFDEFVAIASTMFQVDVTEKYDTNIWDIHCQMLDKGMDHYDPNIHYSLFLHMKKLGTSRESSSER